MSLRKIVMGVALMFAIWLAIFADKTPVNAVVDATVATPSTQKNVQATQNIDAQTKNENSQKSASKNQINIAAIVDRKLLISSDDKANASIFSAQGWTPPPPPPQIIKPPPPPVPTAPPLPFRYLGKKTDDGVSEIYLSNGDRTYIVQVQTVIEGTYRVDAITATQMTLTYLPLNQVQTLQIGSVD